MRTTTWQCPPMPVRVLDLFCGGGGSSRGAAMAGAEIVCGVDANPLAINVYNDNFPGCGVVGWITGESDPGLLDAYGPFDMLLASPECTSHTCARGRRDPSDASRMTALHTLRYVQHFVPRWVVIENVVQMTKWDRYLELLSGLERLGYAVTPQVLDSSWFGVPQSRHRLFLLCERGKKPQEIIPTCQRPVPASVILDPPGIWKCTPLDNGRRAKATLERAGRAMKCLPGDEDFLIVYYGSDAAGGWQRLDRPLRTITTLDRFGLVQRAANGPTLRMLQPRELQRAMGLPSEHVIQRGLRRDRVRILGNGVCPPVMAAIVRSLVVEERKILDQFPRKANVQERAAAV